MLLLIYVIFGAFLCFGDYYLFLLGVLLWRDFFIE